MEEKAAVRPKNKGTKKMFSNPVLETLSRTHTAVPVSIFLTIAVVLIYFGATYYGLGAGVIIPVFLIGVFVFTFVEYVMHRFLFHIHPDTEKKEKLQYTIHGVHHEYPKDRSRLAMPPIISIVVASLLFGIFYLIMGVYAFAFLPGFLTGYSTYLFIHFAMHAFQPPKNFLKILWINHSIHHYKEQDKAFGVSSPFWDFVFGTLPKKP